MKIFGLNKKIFVCRDFKNIILYNLQTDNVFRISPPILNLLEFLSHSRYLNEIKRYFRRHHLNTLTLDDLINKNIVTINKKLHFHDIYDTSILKKEIVRKRKILPSKITLYFSNQCNLSCIHCAVLGGKKRPMELNKIEWLKIVKQAADLKIDLLQITGGEPLLQRNTLRAVLNYAKGKFKHIVVNTNGIRIDNFIAKLLVKVNAIVYVSIYGADKETYKEITSANLFEKAEKGIKVLIENKVDVRAAIPIINQIINNIDKVEKYVKRLGINRIAFMGLIPEGRGRDNFNKLVFPWDKYLPILHEYCARSEVMLDNKNRQIIDIPCHHYKIRLNITSQGSVYPCEFFPIYLGNAQNEKLKDIIKKREAKYIYEEIDADQIIFCKKCAYRYICKAICPSYSYSCRGDYKTPPPTCFFALKNYYKKQNNKNNIFFNKK